MNQIRAWIQASRLPSQSYIFFPILLGQAIWVLHGGKINPIAFILIHLFGLFDQLFIVYANDYADFDTDRVNKTFNIFSGGSRVLVDGLLKPIQLKNAAILMAGLCLLCGIIFFLIFKLTYMVPLIIGALVLLWMYSYGPFKMSYRGGGEILQAIGTGLLLPLMGYYAQSGKILDFPWQLMIVVLPTSLACAISTALPDEPSDKRSNKRLMPVILGASLAKGLIITLNIISIISFYLLSYPVQNQIISIITRLVPALSLGGMILFIEGKPGEVKLNNFVTLSVILTLSIIIGITVSLFKI